MRFLTPDQMRQVEILSPGGPEVLSLREGPVPQPGPGEVLIRVRAAGVNRPDLLQRQGAYPPPRGASPLPGLEVAGEIESVGDGVDEWRKGNAVCALLSGGGYAEFAIAPAAQCLPVPEGLDWQHAAALPETFFTVWANVFQLGELKPGETLLVHGGSSGIGTTAIQMAHALGSQVFTTAGSAAKCEACLRLGASAAINYREVDFAAEVQRFTGARGVDVILDMVGASYTPRNVASLARKGRLVQIAVLTGTRAEVDLRTVMTKRLTITGSTLRPRSVEEKGAIAVELRSRIWPLLASDRIRPVISKVFPLDQAADAHRYLEAGEHIGKVVLVI